ncbi:lipid droplet-associated protein [Mycobacteroides abscessus]|uniref:Lipid droplet-associated protein n=1 Tax=Mycobacteroides abscessus TaxID=36809 RepID=A0A0U0ZQ03_9MYCO|nr:lipid droplet-associated protein [Mycobacteroides abscessus]MBL3733738.1 lipid droplet-associated protein [Mycobacteroides abscessus subsp. massiliense]MBL3746590.1 lipid droplet-associated protein [Mycobacteroides abscessus subsp. massiliense]MBL3762484.1 lipid droplet-associated protein [Mycobacteroides abscessus subsp. massiliense]MBN7481365.1 lipid droplet-associated protein [Mycobacteroides abscessus subsp. massiliense]MDB2217170.1 lipid droplet-associated protein [Mycobacteroides absc
MIRPPFGVRLLLGVAATVLEETRKLPQAVLTYPMTAASQTVQNFMRFQQTVTELAIKGDEAWENIFPPTEEQPEWATFDEDLDELDAPEPDETQATAVYEDAAERMTQGRFALYSSEPAAPETESAPATEPETAAEKAAPRKAPAKKAAPAAPAESADPNAPDVVTELGYHDLTLAQLRARLQSLSVGELEELLAYEDAHKARAPYQTLLANRITRAAARG